MAATTRVEIDVELLARLRARHPGKADRDLIEDVVRVELGFASLRESQRRNGLSDGDAMNLALRAVHESRPSA